MNIKQDILLRARLASVLIGLFAIAILAKLIYVQRYQRFEGKLWKDRIAVSGIRKKVLPASRGNIYSLDGSLMATSMPYYYVGLDTRLAKDSAFTKHLPRLASRLSAFFKDRSEQEYIDLIRSARKSKNKNKRYIRLNSRKITFQERLVIQQWPFFNKDAKKGLGGGKFEGQSLRYNPFGRMALRTVGYLNRQTNHGLVGLEASFDKQLAGKDGLGLVERLAGGVEMALSTDIKPEPGLDVYTTLDVNFQDMAESALKNALEKYRAESGCVIVMEVETGQIRAMANLSREGEEYVETFNHALMGRTDPGSTFKLATMMALLEEKAIRPDQVFDTGSGMTFYYGRRIEDAKRGGLGKLTAEQIFEKSSNVGIHLMMRSYFYQRPDLYCRYLNQFRLTKPTGFQMQGEAAPFIRTPASRGWSRTSLTSMSYGYEMGLTPLQMLTFYNAVANDGRWVRPMIVREVRRADEVVERYEPYVASEPIASAQTIRLARRMLEGVVERGTAKNMRRPHYRIAGKTGTAQKIVNGRYQVGKYYTSFIGYFPAEKPKYTCAVVVDSPKGDNIDLLYAGSVAAPVFGEVADRIFAYDTQMHPPLLAVSSGKRMTDGTRAGYAEDLRTIGAALSLSRQPETEGWVKTQGISWVSQSASSDRVPDVRGMSLRDALYLLENRGFRVRFQGMGKVTDQSVEPGATVPRDRRISLTLRHTARPDTLKPPVPSPLSVAMRK